MDRRKDTDIIVEKSYANREIDDKFNAVHERFTVQDVALEKILQQTTNTNGKVRKIIVALILTVGFLLGATGADLLPSLLKFII